MSYKLDKRIPPIIKYPGGKNRELGIILENIPPVINNYYEPFVGGGSVYFAIDVDNYYINDISYELMNVYDSIKHQDVSFLEVIESFNHNWIVMSNVIDNHSMELLELYINYKHGVISKLILRESVHNFIDENEAEFNGVLQPNFNIEVENFIFELEKSIVNKIIRMEVIEQTRGDLSQEDILKNIEGSFKSAFYTHFRYLYNMSDTLVQNGQISQGYATAIFVFIRQYCYASMFRFNRNGEFNVPYGGISYNRKTLTRNIDNYLNPQTIAHLDKTTLGNEDFYDFLENHPPHHNDFMFVDPPYDTEFSTYDQNEFDREDQIRLADYLINECPANFMVVIKYTEFISNLYEEGTPTANGNRLRVIHFDKRYAVSFKDRNEQEVVHMLIINY